MWVSDCVSKRNHSSLYMDFGGQSYRTSQHIHTSNPRLRMPLVGGCIQALRGILLPRCTGSRDTDRFGSKTESQQVQIWLSLVLQEWVWGHQSWCGYMDVLGAWRLEHCAKLKYASVWRLFFRSCWPSQYFNKQIVLLEIPLSSLIINWSS